MKLPKADRNASNPVGRSTPRISLQASTPCRSSETVRHHQTETGTDIDSAIKSKSTYAATTQFITPAAFDISIRFLYSLFVALSAPLENRQRKIRMVIHYQLLTSSQSSSLGSKISVEGAVLPTDPISNQPHATLLQPISSTLVAVSHSNTAPNTKILRGYQIRSISINQGIFSQLYARSCHTLSIHCTGFFWLRLRINPRSGQAFLEYQVRKSHISTNVSIEGIVASFDIIVTLSKLPCVCCEDARGKATLVCACQQTNGRLVVVRYVKLEEPDRLIACALVIRSCHIFNGIAACCTETAGKAKLACNLRNRQLTLGMVYLVYADLCEADGTRAFMTKERCRHVAVIGIDELLRDDTVSEEGLPVG